MGKNNIDYEKKYKEALNKAKEINNERRAQPFDVMTKVFPELKENECEEIRKDLIKWINEFPDIIWRGHHKKDIIAWLKKQQVEPKEINYEEELKKCRANPLYFFDKYMKVKLKEQEPTWSEEDEENFKDIVGAIHSVAYQTSEEEEARVDWLKSLKDRKDRILPQKQWKPTEEQINALKWQVDHTSEGLWQYKATKELLEQLKQL